MELVLKQKNILYHLNEGITVCSISGQSAGIDLAASLLAVTVEKRSTVYLSGGKTPKDLYEKIVNDEVVRPGAVGQVDERFGEPFHANSNQRMIKETGLLTYLERLNIPFYPILQKEKTRVETADIYDQRVRSLNATFQKSVAILGIGADGHTAGIAGNRQDFTNPLFGQDRKHLFVSEFNDERGYFKERVTMTFLGLRMIDVLLVLVFGDDKKDALNLMFQNGSEEDIPARFYKRSEIAKKTILITDQIV